LAAKNQDGVGLIFSEHKFSWNSYLAAFWENSFWCKSIDNKYLLIKKQTWAFKIWQNLFQNFNFQPISKTFTTFEASFDYLIFVEIFCSKIQKSGFFEDDVIFEKTIVFLLALFVIWGKYWFRVEKNEKNIGDFHYLGLFMAKKHIFNEKKISVCNAPGPLPSPSPLNAKFAYSLDQKI
jgi:hypothetical protein